MGRKTPTFSALLVTLLAAFTPLVKCDGPLILRQELLNKNSTDTHAVPATFGNPPQTINLIISTTSDRSWVYAPSFCESLASGPIRAFCQRSITAGGGRQVTSLFNPNDSNSWKQAASDFTYNGPNNQQRFVGMQGTDKVVIGGIEVPEFEFGVVTKADVDEDQAAAVVGTAGLDGGIGGVLGLGGNSNFLKYLVDKELIKSSAIGVQLASKVIFDDAENVKNHPARRIVPFGTEAKEFGGNIILGGYDAQKLDNGATSSDNGLSSQNEIETTAVQFTSTWFSGANSGAAQSTIEWQATGAGGQDDQEPEQQSQVVGINTVIDSTSPFVLIPKSFWDIISPNWKRGWVNETTGRTYYTDQTAFRDWRNFTFDLVNKDGAKSQLIMQHFDWNVWDPEAQFWAPAFKLQPEGVNTLVLGRPAIRALYVAIDWDKKEVRTQPLKKRTTEEVEIVEVVSGGVERWSRGTFGILVAVGVGAMAGAGLF